MKNRFNINICEFCGKEHDGSYGSGRFCCKKCARKYSSSKVTSDGKSKKIQALTNHQNREKGINKKKNKFSKINKLKTELQKEIESINTELDINLYTSELVRGNESKKKFKNTQKLGKYGENYIVNKFIENDIPVYLPVIDDNGIDMIAEINGKIKKIQVKSSTRQDGVNLDKTIFSLRTSNIKKVGEKYSSNNKSYKSADVDMFALYDAIHDRAYLIENKRDCDCINISQNPTKTKSYTKSMKLANDFDFDYVIDNLKHDLSSSDIIDIN